jgi:hypothetical protein
MINPILHAAGNKEWVPNDEPTGCIGGRTPKKDLNIIKNISRKSC